MDALIRDKDLVFQVKLRRRGPSLREGSRVCIFLGFHSFGLYIHNDTMSALGRPQDMFSDTAIQLQPIFAQWIQNIHAGAPGVTAPGATTSTSLTWGGGELKDRQVIRPFSSAVVHAFFLFGKQIGIG
jgi:photosystem I P700 chlorophyll a apoprotein A1